MTDAEKREAAHQFINRWMGRGNEDEDGRSYWLEFLSNVMGMENPTERVNFEKKVIVNGNTKRIDVYIPETHVIIEQKQWNDSLPGIQGKEKMMNTKTEGNTFTKKIGQTVYVVRYHFNEDAKETLQEKNCESLK